MKLSFLFSPRTFACLLSCSALLGGVSSVHAQSAVVPVPFVTVAAGVPAGGSSTACATSADIANNAGVHTGDGCVPTQATLTALYGSFTDAQGNIYITENGANTDIRVIYRGGSTLAQLLVAANANLTNFTPVPGRIYTLAGSLGAALSVKNGTKYSCNGQTTGPVALDSAGNGCPAAQAYLKPRGLSVDANGNVFFVTNSPGNVLRVIYAGGPQVAALITAENPGVTPQVGFVYKLMGQSTASFNGDGGIASAAAIVVARDVAVDSNGNVYVSDGTSTAASGNSVRVIYGGAVPPAGISNPSLGFIYTFAGAAGCAQGATTCPAGDTGDGGPAVSALVNGPYTLFVDRFNNLFLSEYSGNRLRVVYNSGTVGGLTSPTPGYIYTYAGGGTSTAENTPARQLLFGSVQVSGVDPSGNIYLADATSKRIWRFDALTSIGYVVAGRASGTAPTAGMACNGATGGPLSTDNYGDGCAAVQAAFSDIGRISFDAQGNGYVGENGNLIVRRLSFNTAFPATPVGASTTQPLAYKVISATTLTGESLTQEGNAAVDYADTGTGTCGANSALTVAQVCVFNLAFAPTDAGQRAGSFQLSSAGGAPTNQLLSGIGVAADLAIDPATRVAAGSGLAPSGIVANLFGGIFVSDQNGNRVLKGTSSTATLIPFVTGLKAPAGLALDGQGNLYIADSGNNRIVEVNAAGATVGTFGTGLNAPLGVAVDAQGNMFVADTGNSRVVQIAPNNLQSTVTAITGLAAPTQITIDSLGDIFVADTGNSRVVELAVNATQSVVALPAGVKPTGIAVDAAGTLYVADAGGLQLLAFTPGNTAANVLLTGLVRPVALAADPDANLFLADAGVATVTYLQRSVGNITFPITNVGQPSTSAVNLTNVGNAALNFPTNNLYTRTGSAAFTLAPSSTNGCGAGVSYAAGADCSFTATFLPTTKGAASASVVFNTNANNMGAATALLSGNGQQLVPTSAVISLTAPVGSITYGQAVTITATVTPGTNAGAPTGTVTFTIDNKAQAPVPYGTGAYTLNLNPAVGAHTVSVAFSGDGVYASSAASLSFSVVKADTSTTLALVPVNSNGTITLTFTATVASATASNETGTVSFYSGTTLLSTVALSAANRTATYSTATVSFTPNSFTAVYSGDANFNTSTSAVSTPGGDFAIGNATTAATLPQGGVLNLGFVIAALYGGTGTITPSCTGLPANSICRFAPTVVPISGGTTSVQLELYTNVSSTLAMNAKPAFTGGSGFALASVLPLSLLMMFGRNRRLRSLSMICLLLLAGMMPLTGCGTGSPSAKQSAGLVTPAGTYAVSVVFTGAAPLATRTATFNLTVTPNSTTF